MAGRPVAARGGGLTGAHYLAIVFAFVSVASLGMFIFLLTRVKEAEDRAGNAERRVEKLGQLPGAFRGYYDSEAGARSSTVLAAVGQDLARLAELISGTKDMVADGLERKANELLAHIAAARPGVINPKDTLLTALESLDRRLGAEIDTNQQLAGRLAEQERLSASLTQQLKSTREQFETQITQTRSDYERALTDFNRKLQDKDGQLTELTADLEARDRQLLELKRERDQQVRNLQVSIDRQNLLIADLQKQIQGLKGTFDAEAILKKADGRVLRAIPGSDIVYINLGAKDNVKVGLGFEVYSQAGAPDEGLRGKASLEVLTVMENTAECRVTRSEPGRPIMEGDIVVNIAYEQKRKPKFLVRGEFDLDFNGQTDGPEGLERVKDMIRQWGGQVVSELDETVDFVVVGVAPQVPGVGPEASPIVRDQEERRLRDRAGFDELIRQAQALYIPVITQNQFLFLTGYYGDMTYRQR